MVPALTPPLTSLGLSWTSCHLPGHPLDSICPVIPCSFVQNPPSWSPTPALSLLHPWGYSLLISCLQPFSGTLLCLQKKKNLNSGAKPVFKEPFASLWPLDLPLWPLSPLHHACSCLQLLFGLSSAFSGGLPSFQIPSMPPKAPPTPQQGIYLCTCPCQPDLQPNPFHLWASSLAHRA